MKTSTSLLLLTALLTGGCSSSPETSELNTAGTTVEIPEHLQDLGNLTTWPADRPATHSINLIREASAGEIYSTMMPMFVGPKTAVDQSGRIFIADIQKNIINAYRPDGSLLSSVSRSGHGPGELTTIGTVKTDKDNLYVYDGSQNIIHFYSLETLTHTHTLTVDPAKWSSIPTLNFPSEFEVLDDGSIIIGFTVNDDRESRYIAYYRFDTDLNMVSDQLFERQLQDYYRTTLSNGMAASALLPSERQTLTDFTSDGHIYSAWTEELVISKHSPNGEYLSSFFIPYENSALDPQDIIDVWGDPVRDADYPETWPALHRLIVDEENRIWVSTITDDKKAHLWWVIDDNRELIATFTWPVDELIEHVKNGYVYTRQTNENEISRIVRYRIELTPN